ncbi:MAG: Co2+/Mg2+ efflux protein ApaG [Beijerinckiaceae bacterium]
MYQQTTRNIVISASPRFLDTESQPERARYFWAYTIAIVNEGPMAVQLVARTWQITDGNGQVQDVHGPGVVGEQPVLQPGERYEYTSGCPLTTPHGIMAGHYDMVDAHGEKFSAVIPAFPLHSPHVKQVLN